VSTLQSEIRAVRERKGILLMTHLVLGYPSLDVNREVVRRMVGSGVDLIEMQIPFSEPVADGPVISRACQEAIGGGVTVRQCLDFAAEMTAEHSIPFLFMTYFNIIYKYGQEAFFGRARSMGIRGLIVPDLPPEEGLSCLRMAARHGIAPIQIFAPTSTDKRMRELAAVAEGFVYCVARRGVTGARTSFGGEFDDYLRRCREATELPLAVGFGIQGPEDVAALDGKADIAVIGTRTIRLVEEKGPGAVGPFIASLR
jgi:tryptophan synthase alpha chain